MDGTETGWGRPAEPAPRWRALLDRARHGVRTAEDQPAEPEQKPAPQPQQAPYSSPLPSRPVSAERRPFNPLDPRLREQPGRDTPHNGYTLFPYTTLFRSRKSVV